MRQFRLGALRHRKMQQAVEATARVTRPAARKWLLGAQLVSLGLIAGKVLSYRPFLLLPGAPALVLWSLVLFAYLAAAGWPVDRTRDARLAFATRVGVVAGCLQVIHLLFERFLVLSKGWNAFATLAFMLGTFLFWALTGFRARSQSVPFLKSCIAAMWSAVVTMSIAVPAGMGLEWFIAPVPLESFRTWAEFQRTGWTDLYAFSIANTLDSAASHLLLGPLIAGVFGALAWEIASWRPFFRRAEPSRGN